MVLFGGLWTHRRPHHSSDGTHDDDYQEPSNGEPTPHHHQRSLSYKDTVLFGGLWTRGASRQVDGDGAEERLIPEYGTIDSQDESQQRPSLTGEYEVDTDWDVLRLCGLYTLSYLGIAVVAYSFWLEHWTIIDSLYFAVATFTTVGYGDLQPTTTKSQVFTIAFAVYGVVILGIFIGIVGHAISEGQSKAIRKLKRGRQRKLLRVLFQSTRDTTRPSQRPNGFISDHATLLDDVKEVCLAELPEILVVMLLAYILGVREGWSFTSTMYFAVMSASTTGYGDYTPKTQADKLYCIFFLPLSVAVFGEVLGRIASIYIQRRVRQAEQKFLQRSITLCDLRKMDANHDGMVDMEEFLSFMLVALQKCEKDTIDDIKTIFYSLDVNGNGKLDKEDLIALQQKARLNEIIE